MKEILDELGFCFRNLMLHSDGTWTASSGYKKNGGSGHEVKGNTALEALEKLRDLLQEKGYLQEPDAPDSL